MNSIFPIMGSLEKNRVEPPGSVFSLYPDSVSLWMLYSWNTLGLVHYMLAQAGDGSGDALSLPHTMLTTRSRPPRHTHASATPAAAGLDCLICEFQAA